MFMALIQKVIQSSPSPITTAQMTPYHYQITITIYNAKQKQYPQTQQEWDTYDGIIITGSLSTAYENDKHEWIQTLMDVIQHEIHLHGRKTLGVCFGHQIFAHSFEKKGDKNEVDVDDDHSNYGLAVKCPKGMQVGMREFESLPFLLQKDENHNHNKIKMLYTHGDMVQSIPTCALSLGGNHDVVPIQACAYFTSSDEKDLYLQSFSSLSSLSSSSSSTSKAQSSKTIPPYAITFQGHPEYASKDVGLTTYLNILSFLEQQQKVPEEILSDARQNAKDSFEEIEHNCIELMRNVMITLGWLV